MYFPYVSLNPKGSNLVSTEKYQVIGGIKKIRDDKGEKLILEQKSVDKVDSAVPVK